MPSYSERSRARLATCHPDLQRVFNEVIELLDCSILEGHRDEGRQNKLFDQGLSQLRYPEGKHNKVPSDAVDAAPYPIPEKWGDVPDRKVVARFYHFAGFVLATARSMEIPLRWGGDWDGDGEFTDQTFDDLVHFERVDP